jgi:osmotically-inducible protein OsmY
MAGSTDRDMTSQILDITLKYQRFQASVIRVSVTNGHVTVRGTFHDASDVLFLKHRIAEITGVIRIEIEVQYAV